MKKFFMMLMMALALSMSFTACGLKDAIEDLEEAQEDIPPTLTESKDGLSVTLTYRVSGIGMTIDTKYEVVTIAGLTDTLCCSYIQTQTYALKATAKLAYEVMTSEETASDKLAKTVSLSKDEKSIIIDATASTKGTPKKVVMEVLKAIIKDAKQTQDLENLLDWLD